LQEPRLCVKPVYKFQRAFICGKSNPEFCLIYSEADDPETIFASVNSKNPNRFDKILSGYNICKLIIHSDNGAYKTGEFYESFYYDDITFRLLTSIDENLIVSDGKDDYLKTIYRDFIKYKLWYDCGIIGAFDKNNNFVGYLAYYEIAENIRDVSYIYIKSEHRKLGCAKKLLEYFKNKNASENKISYYSYADGEISEKLAKSCGFLPCAERTEADIKND